MVEEFIEQGEKGEIRNDSELAYSKKLENLVATYKKLIETKKVEDFFPSLRKTNKVNIINEKDAVTGKYKITGTRSVLKKEKERLGELDTVYESAKTICRVENKGNPDDRNKTPEAVEQLAKRATEILEFFKKEAVAIINQEEDTDIVTIKISREVLQERGKEETADLKVVRGIIADAKKQTEGQKQQTNRAGEQVQEQSKFFVTVKVKRSGGEIEDGWSILSIDENGNAVAYSADFKRKVISFKDLSEVNNIPEEELRENVIASLEKNKPKPITSENGKESVAKEVEILKPLSLENELEISRPLERKSKIESTKSKEESILAELDMARADFAKREFTDRTAMDRIQKFLDNRSKNNEHKKKEIDTLNIISARESYEKALQEYKTYKLNELKELASGGKIKQTEIEKRAKELFSFFNLNETTKYYDARTEVKMDYLRGDTKKDETEKNKIQKNWDSLNEKMVGLVQWYDKKVPLAVKLGIGAMSFVPGFAVFAGGRKMLGASMMAVAGGVKLDKLAQFKDAGMDKMARNEMLNNVLAEKDGKKEMDFEKFQSILNERIESIDTKLNDKVLRGGVNKFLAFGAATFLGVSAFNAIADAQVAHVPTTGIQHNSPPATQDNNAIKTSYNPDQVNKNTLAGNKGGDNVNAAGVNNQANTPVGGAPSAPAFEKISIEKGSSIEGALRDHYRELGIKNAGAKAHREYLDYMSKYIEDHRVELMQSGKLKEYQEMLKTGRVNIQIGDSLSVDGEGHLQEIDGEIKMLHDAPAHHHIPTANPDLSASVADPVEIPAPEVQDGLGLETNPEIESNQQEFAQARSDFWSAKRELDGLEYSDTNVGNSAKMPFEESRDRAFEIMRRSANHIQSTAEFQSTQRKLAQEALKTISGGETNSTFLKELGNEKVSRLMDNDNFKPRVKKVQEMLMESAKGGEGFKKSAFDYRLGETSRQWLGRVTNEALKIKYKINEQL